MSLDLEEFKNNLQKFSNERLCEIIVAHRYLGIMRDEALMSMAELARRRENGDGFQYENKIQELTETLPKFNLDIAKILKSSRSI